MKLKVIPDEFSVCRVTDFGGADISEPFCFACRTDEEYSLVCPTKRAPANAEMRDDGWRMFGIAGVLDFSLIGILSGIASLMADNGIGIFAVSTYNTDYIMTKSENFKKALAVLEAAGYEITQERYI